MSSLSMFCRESSQFSADRIQLAKDAKNKMSGEGSRGFAVGSDAISCVLRFRGVCQMHIRRGVDAVFLVELMVLFLDFSCRKSIY